jgi:hypothetical protein
MRSDLRCATAVLTSPALVACLLYAPIPARAAHPAAAPPADARVFSIVPQLTVGKTFRYYTVNGLTLAYHTADGTLTQRVALSLTMRYRALEVAQDGSVRFSAVSEGGSLKTDVGDDALAKESDDYPRTVLVDRKDRILSVKDDGANARGQSAMSNIFSQANLLIQTHMMPLPDGPVKIGDSWNARYPLPNVQGGRKHSASDDITANLTLIGVEMLGKQETLKVKQVFTIPADIDIDEQGQAITGDHRPAGHVSLRMTYTLEANIGVAGGEVIVSQGKIKGAVKFTGLYAKQMPSDSLDIVGSIAVSQILDTVAPAATGSGGATH